MVDGIKAITAYHAGDKVWAEYDILFPEKMPLGYAHDIAETLQYCCEGGKFHPDSRPALSNIVVGLDEVDRAFVTTDCEFVCILQTLSSNC